MLSIITRRKLNAEEGVMVEVIRRRQISTRGSIRRRQLASAVKACSDSVLTITYLRIG